MTPEQARLAERKAIVEWVKEQAKMFAGCDSSYEYGKSVAYAVAVNAIDIERGKHLKKGQE